MVETLLFTFQRIKILDFQAVLMLIILTFLVQIICMLFGVDFFACLACCPMIYLYKKNINEKFLLHKKYNLLYRHATYFVIIILIDVLFNSVISYILNILFLIIYLLLIDTEIKKQIIPSLFLNSKNIISIYSYFTILSIIILLINLFEKKNGKVFNVNFDFVLLGIIIICIIFSVVFLLTLKKEIRNDEKEVSEIVYEKVDETIFTGNINNPLVKEINVFFENNDIYLNPNFTIKDLANILGTNRERVSEVMNRDMRGGFYNIIAQYRIEHAKKIILENDNLTIEALIVQCGFHSKSTFNKYFKIYTGMLPSVYRKENMIKSNIL